MSHFEPEAIQRVPRGEVAANYVPTLLFGFLDQRLTGRVTCTYQTHKIDLMLENGEIIGARSNDLAMRLGEILLTRGKIKVSDYEKSVLRMLEEGIRQGQALLESRAVDEDTLGWAIRRQTKDIVYKLFSWPRVDYAVKPLTAIAQQDRDMMPLSTHEVIVRGLKRLDDWPRIRNEFFPYKQVFAINQSIGYDDAKKIRIKADEEKVLSLVNGRRTVSEILEMSQLGGYESVRRLFAFKHARMITLVLGERDDTLGIQTLA